MNLYFFYCGLGVLRFIIRELLETLFSRMRANPAGGAEDSYTSNIFHDTDSYRVPAVPDPTGVANRSYSPHSSSQPYAKNLAQHLETIKDFNGGMKSPCLNSHVSARDKAWSHNYLTSLRLDPQKTCNGK